MEKGDPSHEAAIRGLEEGGGASCYRGDGAIIKRSLASIHVKSRPSPVAVSGRRSSAGEGEFKEVALKASVKARDLKKDARILAESPSRVSGLIQTKDAAQLE
jgi:hypothetical protein